MRENKSLKMDFYLLVIKVVFFTIVSSIIIYSLFLLPIYNGSMKPTNYYLRYLDNLEVNIRANPDKILNGEILDLSVFGDKIQGEVVDVHGKHIYGEIGLAKQNIDYWRSFNRDFVKNYHVYRYIPLIKDNKLEGIYVLRAPFGFIINNIKEHPFFAITYIPMIFSPMIFFMLYLFIFTRKLYLDISSNLNILLEGADNVSNKNFGFKIDRLNGKEFNKIQEAFNAMVYTIKETLKNLWKMDEERKKILSSITHDIRTPITIIKGQTEIMMALKNKEDFPIESFIQIINNNCNRIINLTNNLSLLYKVEKIDFLLRVHKVDLYKILKEKEKEFKIMTMTKKLQIYFDINLNKSYYLLDETMLLSVLDNILYNSFRFTSNGEIRLMVHDENNSDKIYFKCMDTGKGFNVKDTSKLFDAFYQEENYKDHFGLGLYIAKRIVENFKGDIWAYNRKDGGAIVEFYIRELKNKNSKNVAMAPSSLL
ncbi:HAMP domain-containing histidine kinase [Aceticella autotrophica]|uniref:histidine kinase n=1 Tax=Aceticella autotrophica TaxID=2755338 RepID=A0A975GAG5_9THEO|nr:HAMP domain-containing sensor histidine kinase [Aceticella autotrophica]QSZ27444.1 HAMP domain-containing histidine kinase [Aceticella autotrophica]